MLCVCAIDTSKTCKNARNVVSTLYVANASCYHGPMIKSFADKDTERLFKGRRSKTVPADLQRRALAKLVAINTATSVEELRTPASNRLHAFKGKRAGQWAIAVNKQYRVCFRFEDEANDAYDVEITDYH